MNDIDTANAFALVILGLLVVFILATFTHNDP